MSSIETKVGSPPMVSRMSCAAMVASTFSPSASSACHDSSENGLVMRGCSATRLTCMSKSKLTCGLPTAEKPPVIGAALR